MGELNAALKGDGGTLNGNENALTVDRELLKAHEKTLKGQ